MAVVVIVAFVCLIVGFALGVLVVLRSNGLVQRLSNVTKTLERTLGSPSERGTWGEWKLRQVVELAGMEQWCDFDEQVVLSDGHRPDLVARVPGDRRVIVDSGATLDAKGLRNKMRQLAAKRYWEKLPGSLDFVVQFIPLESALGSALQEDPSLLEEAARQNVMLATPATLVAILRFVAHGWRQEKFARSAAAVQKNADELYSRLEMALNYMTKLGKHLSQAVGDYNRLVGSVEGRLLPSARRMHELGIGPKELEPVASSDVNVRELRSSTIGLIPAERDEGGDQDQTSDDDEIVDWTA